MFFWVSVATIFALLPMVQASAKSPKRRVCTVISRGSWTPLLRKRPLYFQDASPRCAPYICKRQGRYGLANIWEGGVSINDSASGRPLPCKGWGVGGGVVLSENEISSNTSDFKSAAVHEGHLQAAGGLHRCSAMERACISPGTKAGGVGWVGGLKGRSGCFGRARQKWVIRVGTRKVTHGCLLSFITRMLIFPYEYSLRKDIFGLVCSDGGLSVRREDCWVDWAVAQNFTCNNLNYRTRLKPGKPIAGFLDCPIC